MNLVITILFLISSHVLCEFDLCRNPRIDSITYVEAKNMWFFTSGGYYWYLKEESFPPTIENSRGKLPNGFVTGEAVVFINTLKVCGTALKGINSEQMVLVLERIGTENKIIEFDVRTSEWTQPHSLSDDHFLSRIKIHEIDGEVKALFSYRESEIYAVQGKYYSAIKWNNLCINPNDFGDNFGNPENSDQLGSTRGTFGAITTKDQKMYQFIDSSFWVSDIDEKETKNGKIVIIKGNERQISKEFFKYSDCPTSNTTITTINTNVTTDIEEDWTLFEGNSNVESKSSKDSEDFFLFMVTFIVVIALIILIFSSVIAYSIRRTPTPVIQYEMDVINKLYPESSHSSSSKSNSNKTQNPEPKPKSTKTTQNKSIATKNNLIN